jgi:proteic killer suppression protein
MSVEKFDEGEFVGKFKAFDRTLERRLRALKDATTLEDIRSVPGHYLEPLQGNRAGQHSIKINAQYRICFV